MDGGGDVPCDRSARGLLRRDGPGRAQPRRRPRHGAGRTASPCSCSRRARRRTSDTAARGLTMAADVSGLMRATTKWSAVAGSPEQIPGLVRTAVREALSGRPGPVYLELPADVLATAVGASNRPSSTRASERVGRRRAPPRTTSSARRACSRGASGRCSSRAAGSSSPMHRAELRRARRAARRGGDRDADGPRRGVERRPGVLRARRPDRRRARAARPAGGRRRASRRLLACRRGSGREARPRSAARPAQRVIHLDVDPSAAAGVLPGRTLVLAGDVRDGAHVAPRRGRRRPRDGGPHVARLARRGAHGAPRAALFDGADEPVAPMHPAALARELGDWLPDDALVVYDGGHTTFWSNDLTPALEPRTRFHDPGMAHLGFGLPYALALQAAFPGRTRRERHGRRRLRVHARRSSTPRAATGCPS